MDIFDLQHRLEALGHPTDGAGEFGPVTQVALIDCLGTATPADLDPAAVAAAADQLGITPAHIMTVWLVAASADPVCAGKPSLIFEPRRFSIRTGGMFDASHPEVSSATWSAELVTPTLAERHAQLIAAIGALHDAGLPLDAAFTALSFGGFQILGENFIQCGFDDAPAFAFTQAQGPTDQLATFVTYMEATGLNAALQRGHWSTFAELSNRTAYNHTQYAERLVESFILSGTRT